MTDFQFGEDRRPDYHGPTIEMPTNWVASRIADYAAEQKAQADTQASRAHWSQLEYRIRTALSEENP